VGEEDTIIRDKRILKIVSEEELKRIRGHGEEGLKED